MTSAPISSAPTTHQRRAHTVVGSPIGPLTLVAAGGRLAGVHMERERHPADPGTFGEHDADAPVLAEAARQLDAYFAGELTSFDLPLAPSGTPFQRRVWAALAEIPYGETASYREIAERIGQPTAARAVGLANGRNPIPIIVPCHRVVGASGSLTGYGGGLDRKEHLLTLEKEVLARRDGRTAAPTLFDRGALT